MEYKDAESGVGFKGARVYGFKNIQNLIRQLKTAPSNSRQYQYIELMACPGGCFNGGGQIKPKDQENRTIDDLREDYEVLTKKYMKRRYFFENEVAEKLCTRIYEDKTSLCKRAAIEYNIQPLETTDNPVFMKW